MADIDRSGRDEKTRRMYRRMPWFYGVVAACLLITAIAGFSQAGTNRPLRYYTDDGSTAMTYYTNGSGNNTSFWGINTDNPRCEFDINGTVCINGSSHLVQGVAINGTLISADGNNYPTALSVNQTGSAYSVVLARSGLGSLMGNFSVSGTGGGIGYVNTTGANFNSTNWFIRMINDTTAQAAGVSCNAGDAISTLSNNSVCTSFITPAALSAFGYISSAPNVNITGFTGTGSTVQLNLSNGSILNATVTGGTGTGNATSNGTANYVARFTNGTNIGTGSITDNNSMVSFLDDINISNYYLVSAGDNSTFIQLINSAPTGSTIQLSNGTYNLNNNTISPSKSLIIKGAGRGTIIYTNTTSYLFNIGSSGTTIRDLDIIQTNAYTGTAIRLSGQPNLIENVRIYNFSTGVLFVGFNGALKTASIYNTMTGVNFQANLNSVYDTWVYVPNVSGAIGYYFGNYSPTNGVRSNTVYDSNAELAGCTDASTQANNYGWYFSNYTNANYVFGGWAECVGTDLYFDDLSRDNYYFGEFGYDVDYDSYLGGSRNTVIVGNTNFEDRIFFNGNVTANYFVGDGHLITNLSGVNDTGLSSYRVSAYYPLNNNTEDLSENNLDGTNNGSFENKGIYGNAFYFNRSTSQYIEVANNGTLDFNNTNFSVSAWIKPTDLSAAVSYRIVSKRNGNYGFLLYVFGGANPSPTFFVGNQTTSVNPSNSIFNARSDVWTHIAGVYNGTAAIIYVNGEFAASSNITNIQPATSTTLRIGNDNTGTAGFNGTIDEVIIFNRSLSQEEVKILSDNKIEFSVQDAYKRANFCLQNGTNCPAAGAGNVTATNGTAGYVGVFSSASNLVAMLINSSMVGDSVINKTHLYTNNAGSSDEVLAINTTGGIYWKTDSTGSSWANTTGSNGTSGYAAVWTNSTNLLAMLINSTMIGDAAVNATHLYTSNTGSAGQVLTLNSTGGMNWSTPSTGSSSGGNASINGDGVFGTYTIQKNTTEIVSGNLTENGVLRYPNNATFSKYLNIGGTVFPYNQPRRFKIAELEFLRGGTNTGGIESLALSTFSSGSSAAGTGNADHPGVLILQDSATALGGSGIFSDVGAFLLAGGENFTVIFQIRSGQTGNSTTKIGFHDVGGAGWATDGCYWSFDNWGTGTGGPTRQAEPKCASNSAQTKTTNFTYTNNTWYVGNIYVDPTATNVTFTIMNETGGVLQSDSITSNIPTAAGRVTGAGVIFTQNTTSAAAAGAYLDYLSLVINRELNRGLQQ